MVRTLAFSALLALSVSAIAQDDIPLRKTLNMVGNDLEGSARLQEASVFLYYVGGLLVGIGFDKNSDALLLTGGSMVVGGIVTTSLSIGRKRSAARLLKEL